MSGSDSSALGVERPLSSLWGLVLYQRKTVSADGLDAERRRGHSATKSRMVLDTGGRSSATYWLYVSG